MACTATSSRRSSRRRTSRSAKETRCCCARATAARGSSRVRSSRASSRVGARETSGSQKSKGPEWGSDVIVDLLKAYEIRYVSFNPGSTFRGLHDSIVNYGGNTMPEVILCNHEAIAVYVAHGYAKATGKPM